MKSLEQAVKESFEEVDEDQIAEMKWKGRRQSTNVEDRRTNLQKKTTTFNRVASMNRNAKPVPKDYPIPYKGRNDYKVQNKND